MSSRAILVGLGLMVAASIPPSRAATMTAAPAEVLVDGQGRNVTMICGEQAAAVTGSHNQVTFIGPCRGVRVVGDHNVVVVELARAGTVGITGDYNQLAYAPARPPPLTTLKGFYNQVVPAPLPPAPNTLFLDGTLGRRDVHCDGLDVVIRESDARYVLRGGCRSVTVEGTRNTIAAELLPSARLVISGVGVVINYVLTAQGEPPVVLVNAPHAKATHFVRIGESAFKLPTETR